jgi:hypothetical protein
MPDSVLTRRLGRPDQLDGLPTRFRRDIVLQRSYQREHHRWQAILARQLQDDGPHPLEPEDVAGVVERERAKAKGTSGPRGLLGRQCSSDCLGEFDC